MSKRAEGSPEGQAGSGPVMRVGYLSGPADADRMYDDMIAGRPPVYFGTNYMRQFLALVGDLGAEALVETWHGERKSCRRMGSFIFNDVPEPRSSGIVYHLAQVGRQLAVLWRMLRYRPDLLVLTGKQGYWWVLSPLRLLGTRFVASFHCVLWPPFGRMKWHEKLLLSLDRWFVLRHLDAVVSTSRMISDQFRQMAGKRAGQIPLFEHLPSYEQRQFEDIAPAPPAGTSPFAVMFMGRIEANKGVYDLLTIAQELQSERPGEFEFHVCGDGSELERLRQRLSGLGLESVFHLHGYCTPNRMKSVMSASNAVVVPTRSDFVAGFEMTCAEAVLGGRPLITSAVCPALDYLRPAAIEVPPDDVAAYKAAIVRLKDDPSLYTSKQGASKALAGQFFDHSNSWDAAMRRALSSIFPARVSRPSAEPSIRSC